MQKFFAVTMMRTFSNGGDRTSIYRADSIKDIFPVVDEQISALERAGAPRFHDWENYDGEWSRRCFANEPPSPYVFMVREVLPMDLEGHPGVQCVF